MRKITLLCILMSLLIVRGFAQPAATRLAEVRDGDFDRYDVVTVFDSTSVMMEESGLSHVYNHKLWKILSDEGARDFNNVKMDYDPQSAYVEIREVVVYRKDGKCYIIYMCYMIYNFISI